MGTLSWRAVGETSEFQGSLQLPATRAAKRAVVGLCPAPLGSGSPARERVSHVGVEDDRQGTSLVSSEGWPQGDRWPLSLSSCSYALWSLTPPIPQLCNKGAAAGESSARPWGCRAAQNARVQVQHVWLELGFSLATTPEPFPV